MGEFAEQVKRLHKQAAEGDWEGELAHQEARFRAKEPLSQDLAVQEAARRLKKYQQLAWAVGYAARKSRPPSELEEEVFEDLEPGNLKNLEASPGREVVIPLPATKTSSWMDQRFWSKEAGAITEPLTQIGRASCRERV